MPVFRRPRLPRVSDLAWWRTRVRSVSRGGSVAALVLGLATAASGAGIVTSNGDHGAARAVAARIPAAGSGIGSDGSSLSAGASPVTAQIRRPVPRPSTTGVALPVAATTTPDSQGQPGVIPVPLAPRAVAGPIPLLAWQAYHRAAAGSRCRLPWYLLAGIGKIESDHGRFHGARFDVTGAVHPAILGPPTAYGRAMGPMQFIPPTWASYAADGNGDGTADPQNIFDATKAAAHYLCNAGGADLSGLAAQRRAVFAYNHLDSYVADVLAFAAAYQHGRSERSVSLVPITYPKPAATTASSAVPPTPTVKATPSTTPSKTRSSTTPHPTTTATTTSPTTTSPSTRKSTPRSSTAPSTGAAGTCGPATTATPRPNRAPASPAAARPSATSTPAAATSSPAAAQAASVTTTATSGATAAPTCPSCPTTSATSTTTPAPPTSCPS